MYCCWAGTFQSIRRSTESEREKETKREGEVDRLLFFSSGRSRRGAWGERGVCGRGPHRKGQAARTGAQGLGAGGRLLHCNRHCARRGLGRGGGGRTARAWPPVEGPSGRSSTGLRGGIRSDKTHSICYIIHTMRYFCDFLLYTT